MKPLRTLETFHDLTVNMSSNPILGVVIGTVFTVIVQSSSATIGILQGLFGEGLLELKAAIPVLFGDNIGTTITAVLASIGASVAAKRAAFTHVLFNIIGTIIFMIFLGPFIKLISYLQTTLHLNPEMTIAFAHGTFNVTNTIIQFPFIAGLAYIVTKLIPGEDTFIEYKSKHLDPVFIEQSPAIALGQAREEVVRMGGFAVKGLEESNTYLNEKSQKYADTAMQIEDAINNLDKKITDYLIKISSRSLSAQESALHSMLVNTVRDIERIGDHFENVVELVDYQISNKVKLTDDAIEDLNEMFKLTVYTVSEAVQSLQNNDRTLAIDVVKQEEKIDSMERSLRKSIFFV